MSANYVTVRNDVLVEFSQVFCILPQNRINDISDARFLMIKFPATSVRVCTLARCKKVLLAGFGKSERVCCLVGCHQNTNRMFYCSGAPVPDHPKLLLLRYPHCAPVRQDPAGVAVPHLLLCRGGSSGAPAMWKYVLRSFW